jgi:hypothetical protein
MKVAANETQQPKGTGWWGCDQYRCGIIFAKPRKKKHPNTHTLVSFIFHPSLKIISLLKKADSKYTNTINNNSSSKLRTLSHSPSPSHVATSSELEMQVPPQSMK